MTIQIRLIGPAPDVANLTALLRRSGLQIESDSGDRPSRKEAGHVLRYIEATPATVTGCTIEMRLGDGVRPARLVLSGEVKLDEVKGLLGGLAGAAAKLAAMEVEQRNRRN